LLSNQTTNIELNPQRSSVIQHKISNGKIGTAILLLIAMSTNKPVIKLKAFDNNNMYRKFFDI